MLYPWLPLLPLITLVAAFYPYHDQHGSGHKRATLVAKQDEDMIQPSDVGTVTLDLHRVQRRQNRFPVVLSNKPAAANALAINQDGADYSYFSTLTFGSKARAMYMLVDTGSANTWVFSSMCTSSTCSIHNTFGKDDSTGLTISSSTWSLVYGSGSVNGVVATDKVSFANFSVNLGFGLATNASKDFDNYPMDGILGLGRATSDQLNAPTVMQTLAKQAGVTRNVIGVRLHRGSDNTNDGELTFGGVNTAKFSGPVSYTAARAGDSWEIPIEDVLVNDKPCNFVAKTAIVDTGTTYLLLPPADAKTIHALIPGAVANGESFTVPCNSNANIQVRISGKLYSISPKDYVGRAISGGCSSTIIGHQAFTGNQWILGDVFLKNVYAVFDYDQGKIGFANLASATTNQAQSSSGSVSNSMSSISGSATVLPASQTMTSTTPSRSSSVGSTSASSPQVTSTSPTSTATSSTGSPSSPSTNNTATIQTHLNWQMTVLVLAISVIVLAR